MNFPKMQVITSTNENEISLILAIYEFCRKKEEKRVGRSP